MYSKETRSLELPKLLENCPAGHKMTTENTYWQRKHGNTYAVCRECKRIAGRERNKQRYTKIEQNKIAKRPVVQQDITGLTQCPKCDGRLRFGIGNEIEDALSCIYCGWRPNAQVEVEL